MRVSSFHVRLLRRSFGVTIGFILFLSVLPAQLFEGSDSGGPAFFGGMESAVLRGRVDSGGETNQRLTIVLTQPGGVGGTSTADVRSTGDFELLLREPPRSGYQLTVVETYTNRILHREHGSWSPGQNWLEIVLPKPKAPQAVTGWVTLNQLRQSPPKRARKEFARSQKSMSRGDFEEAVGHLEKALAIYPSYVDAHHQLGLAHLKQQEYSAASESFYRALEIDPLRADSLYCLGLALVAVERFDEAEAAAREAVRLRPGMPWAHYVLGLVLLKSSADKTEAVTQLRQAAPSIPVARIGLAHVLAYQGKREEAAVELKEYLDSGAKDNRQWAEAWIRKLRGQ